MSQNFIKLCSVISLCEAWQWTSRQHLRWVSKNDGSILSRLWTKVHEILEDCRKSLVVSNALLRFSIACLILKIFAIKSRSRRKTTKCIRFGRNLWRGITPKFSRQIVSAICFLSFRKVWLNSVCWPPCARPDNEVECRINGAWIKKSGPILRNLWTKVHRILRWYRRLLVVFNARPRFSISCFIPKLMAVKVAVKLRSRRKTSKTGGLIWAPDF